MIRINDNYSKLKASYLFADIAKRVNAYVAAHPGQPVIRLGIGDVTEPLPPVCIAALHAATDEMANRATFKGYGPEQGYAFLREAIAQHDFQTLGAHVEPDEVFVSDGSKCDVANIQEIFAADTKLAIPDPVYPVYVDTNVMAGRTGANVDGRYTGIIYLDSTAANGYVPSPPSTAAELIYLCFPNNPTGAVATRAQLTARVAYAKLAGFTGLRCAYTVVPKTLKARDAAGHEQSVHALWNRRHTTKFNGVSYPVQKAAAAVYTAEGQKQTRDLTDFYLGNAKLIREAVTQLGMTCIGGDNAPYIWVNTGRDSWEFFDLLLNKAQVVCTPGAGFGKCGEGHVRISAFNSRENVTTALARIAAALK